jgi:translation elongation factor EF-1beta
LARVLVSLKIFPADIDVNRDALKTEIKETLPDYASIYKFEEEQSSLRKMGKISDFQTLMVRRV